MTRYCLTCDGALLLTHRDPDVIEAHASYHAGTVDHLDWQYDPEAPTITTAEYRGRTYRIEIVRWEDRHAPGGVS